MMEKNDNLFAHKGCGRPSVKEAAQLYLYGKLKEDLQQLRKDMSMQNGK